MPTQTFYNGTKGSDIEGDKKDPNKCGIHHWAEHGIVGRGILIDYWTYAKENGIVYGMINLSILLLCAKKYSQILMNIIQYHSPSFKLVEKPKGLILDPPLREETFKLEISSSSALVSYQLTTPNHPMLEQQQPFDHTPLVKTMVSAGLELNRKNP